MKFPNTPTQDWLKIKGACVTGRRRVGRKTLGQAWKTTRSRNNLIWLLYRLNTDELGDTFSTETSTDIDNAKTVKELRQIAVKYPHLQIPLGLV